MEYVYKSVKCPKCGKTTERSVSHSREHYGSPLRVCRNCGTTYFDDSYIEKGLAEYSNKGGDVNIVTVFFPIAFTVAALFFLYGIFMSIFTAGPVGTFIFAFIPFGALATLFDVGLVKSIKNHKNSDEFFKKQLDLIEGKGGYEDEELARSMSRLSDRGYLDALKSCGVEVPDYFYERLNQE